MAKGLGAMMAAANMQAADPKVTMICPLCGQIMAWEEVAWFCRSGPRRSNGAHEPCSLSELVNQFTAAGNWVDEFICGNVIAAVVVSVEGGQHQFPVRLMAVRGYAGCTNLSVQCDHGISRAEAVAAIAAHGWTWAEWTGRE